MNCILRALDLAIMNTPAVQQLVFNTGTEPSVLIGAEFGKFMRDDFERFGAAAKAANLKQE